MVTICGLAMWETSSGTQFMLEYDNVFYDFPTIDEIIDLHCHVVDKKTMKHEIYRINNFSIHRNYVDVGSLIIIYVKIDKELIIISNSFTIQTKKKAFDFSEFML